MDWQTIKHFGKIKYFNISYVAILIVPIANEVINYVNTSFEEPKFFIPCTIIFLYASSLFYALGIAIYQFFCPKIIKSYDKVQDYIRDNFQIYMMAYPDLKIEIIRANLSDLQDKSKEKIEALLIAETDESRVELEKLTEMLLPSCVQQYLTKEYNNELVKYKFLMWASLLLYITGSIIILFLLFNKSYTIIFN